MKTIKRAQLKQFDILFWQASFKQAKLGWLIRTITGDVVNHVGWYVGTKMGFPLAYESTRGGPSVNEFSKTYPPKYVGRFKIPLSDIMKLKLIMELHKLDPRKYDWVHLLGYFVGFDSVKKIMCPELINEPLKAVGRALRRNNEKPSGIFYSSDLEIFELVC